MEQDKSENKSLWLQYPKIHSIYKRDEKTHTFIEGAFSLPEFEYLKDNLWVFTEKVDGMNIRVDWNCELKRVQFGGRTDNAQIPTFLYRKLEEIFSVEKFNRTYPETSMCLYGEGYGVKIQKGGKYISDGVNFILFDILIHEWWLKREDIEDIAQKLGIAIVPIVGEGTLADAIALITSHTLKSHWGDFLMEGLVLKTKVELKTRVGHRIITKIKHSDYKNMEVKIK
jgi:hypothetical protein